MLGKRVYTESFGCPSNQFDLEVMMGHLEEDGCTFVDNAEDADVLIVNTCGVKKPTEDKILHRLQNLRKLRKPVLITGCLTKIDLPALQKAITTNVAYLDPFSINQVTTVMTQLVQNKLSKCYFTDVAPIKLTMHKLQSKEIYEIVPISEGCLGKCAFCCTRFARGSLFSYPSSTIVDTIQHVIAQGKKEIWITAQDTGAYGIDRNCDLPSLLEAISTIKGDFRIRVGMMNPKNLMNTLDRLIVAFQNDKIYKFLHLPVQSGNDHVLQQMNRFYQVKDFKRIVNTFRKNIPELTLSTDVICGFPSEDETAFQDSLRLLEEVEPDIVNISKFAPRPKTIAATMKQPPSQIVKARSKRMTNHCKAISLIKNRRWINWSGTILVNEIGRLGSLIGRNFAYKPVVINGKRELLGKRIIVQVTKATPTYLIGEPVT
jgi:MiaB-like tRNA modifying enzyme